MKYSVPASVLALAASTSALPATKQQAKHQHAKRATPKVWLAGDSTMASGGGGSGTQGTHLHHPPPTSRLPPFQSQPLTKTDPSQAGANTSNTL